MPHDYSETAPIMPPVETAGYEKIVTRRLEKFYLAKVTCNRKKKLLGQKHRTANAAVEYGKRFKERYNRIAEYYRALADLRFAVKDLLEEPSAIPAHITAE